MAEEEILVALYPGVRDIVHERIGKRVAEAGFSLRAIYSEEPLEEAALCDAVKDSAGLIVGLERVSGAVIAAGRKLRVVSKFGVGTDNIDVSAASSKGVAVANCPGSNSNAVAELAVGLMISLARNTQVLCSELRAKHWRMSVGSELSGKTIGILGFGNVGRKLARYLKPFDVEMLVYDAFVDRAAETEFGVRYAALDEIARNADYVSVHLPLLPETRHLIGADFFSKTKPGVFVLNLARGSIIDENALYDAVVSGRVLRAATDVFEFEPPTASRLLDDERIIVLPHIGAATRESTQNMADMAVDNVVSVLSGKGNPHPVRA